MKDRKLLFFDIDGTLLSEKTHTVPQSAKEALKKAKENGHLIFINTGRPISTIDQEIHDLNQIVNLSKERFESSLVETLKPLFVYLS